MSEEIIYCCDAKGCGCVIKDDERKVEITIWSTGGKMNSDHSILHFHSSCARAALETLDELSASKEV